REVARNRLLAGGALLLVLALVAWGCSSVLGGSDATSTTASKDGSSAGDGDGSSGGSGSGDGSSGGTSKPAADGLAPERDYDGWVDPASSG
ncbi:MAG: hypothetical protein KDB04_00175, partial [Acidimicrobiales bacterium]|nr:hypothetical protein [Acidimicrobiales bacterium]